MSTLTTSKAYLQLLKQQTVSMEEIEDSKKIITKYLEEEVKLVSAKNVFIGGFS